MGLRYHLAVAERASVRKSMMAIAGLGLAGCLVLAFLMRQAVEMEGERREPPFLPALRARFGPRLERPLRLRAEVTSAGTSWRATAYFADAGAADDLVPQIGAEIWLHAQRQGATRDVRVQVHVPGAPPRDVDVPLPAPLR